MPNNWTVREIERHGALLGDRLYRCHQAFPRDGEPLRVAAQRAVESLPGWTIAATDPANRRLEVEVQADAVGWLTGTPSKRQLTLWVSSAEDGPAALEGTIRLRFVGLIGRELAAGQGAAEALWSQLAQAVELQLAAPEASTTRVCGGCGAAIPAGARFCGVCGAAVQG